MKAKIDAPSSAPTGDFPLLLKSNSNPSSQGRELCWSLQADHVPLSFIHSFRQAGDSGQNEADRPSQGAGTAAPSSATLCHRAFAHAVPGTYPSLVTQKPLQPSGSSLDVASWRR